jgi:outer membrane protein assembly factor BamB
MTTNLVRWKCQLGDGPHNYNFFRHLYDQAEKNTAYFPNARFRFFHTAGHLAVFQVGTMVYGLDMDNAKLLWQHCLVDPVLPFNTQVMPDEQGVLWVTTRNQFGQIASRKKVGHLGTVQPSYVALTSSKGLVVLDPLRGNVMWTKPNISPSAEVFGDDQYLYLVEATDAGDLGVGRVLRASDGQPVAETKDFSYLYRSRLRVLGGHLLAADKAGGQLTLRLYDVRAGKDLWSKTFDSSARVLATEDPYLAGVIEPDGKLTVVDLKARAVALTASVMNGRVSEEDIKGLREPLLLRDNDLYYVALNQAVDANKVGGGVLANNFGNGLRCRLVNGWVLAFDQKGEFQWHTHDRVSNQMVVLEQFEQLPILLFSVRYTEKIQGGIRGERMVAYTGSVDKKTGKAIWWPLDPRPNNGVAQFFGFNLDARLGTINLVGYSGVLQHYLDDGRGPPTEAGGTPGGIKGSDLVPPVLPPNDRPPPPNIKPGPAVKPVIKGKGVKPIKKEAQPLPLRVPPGMQPPLPAEVLPLELPRRSNEGVVPQKK